MFMRCILFCSIFFFHLYSQAGSFTTNPTEIPGGTTTYYTVTPCYITKSNQILFAWADNDTSNYPIKYIVYNGNNNTYTAPVTIEGSTVYENIFCCYNESTNQVFFSWEEYDTPYNPYYAIYNANTGTLDTGPTIIDTSTNGVYNNNVFCCYNKTSNEVIFTWSNGDDGSPYYAIYNCNSSAFSKNATQIGNIPAIAADVFACCSNNFYNKIVFSWIEGSSPYLVQYAICDGKSGNITTGPTSIPGSTAGFPASNSGPSEATCCYNSLSNQVIFSWGNTDNIPYYSILNPLQNTISKGPTPIVTEPYTGSIYDFIFCSYSSVSNEVFFSWAPYNFDSPPAYYSIYNMTTNTFNSTSPSIINGGGYDLGVYENIFSSYNSTTNQIVFGWSDYTNYKPYYSVYTASSAQQLLIKAINKWVPLKTQQ
jgi:hypothetical protein